MTHTMVVGTSEPQDFQLLDDGVAIDGTGFTLAIEWSGEGPTSPPTVAWLVQSAGTVRAIDCDGMAVGVYRFRWKLTDGASNIGYFPNQSQPDHWRVVSV